MTQPEKEVCFLSKNSVSLSKRLEDVDVQKDFEMFVMRPHNVPSISHAQKIDSSPYSPKATKALMLYGQDSTPLLPRCLFGQSLETLIEQENCEVPALVTRCIQYVEENALDTVGIYRIPGSAKKVGRLKFLAVVGACLQFVFSYALTLLLFVKTSMKTLIAFSMMAT